jgi:hypothetical protein
VIDEDVEVEDSLTTDCQETGVIQNSGTERTGKLSGVPENRGGTEKSETKRSETNRAKRERSGQGVSSVSRENDVVGWAVQVSM